MKVNKTNTAREPFLFEELEPRVLFSADFAPALIDIAPQEEELQEDTAIGESVAFDESQDQLELTVTASGAENEDAIVRHEVVFVDANTPDAEQLVSGLLENPDDSRRIEVVYLDGERDGIEQITEALADRQDIDAVHIISHGSESGVQLGDTWLSAGNLSTYSDAIQSWGDALDSEADLLIYGCNLAAGADGRALLGALGGLTGADVAASDDLTGSALLGGDWDLEYLVGSIETDLAVDQWVRASWEFTLTNNPPVNSVPGPQVTAVDTPIVFSGANKFSVSDAESGSNPLEITLTATSGTLSLSGTTGLNFSVGTGTGDATMTFQGTISNINTALDG